MLVRRCRAETPLLAPPLPPRRSIRVAAGRMTGGHAQGELQYRVWKTGLWHWRYERPTRQWSLSRAAGHSATRSSHHQVRRRLTSHRHPHQLCTLPRTSQSLQRPCHRRTLRPRPHSSYAPKRSSPLERSHHWAPLFGKTRSRGQGGRTETPP